MRFLFLSISSFLRILLFTLKSVHSPEFIFLPLVSLRDLEFLVEELSYCIELVVHD